jgi:hypothetical protein
MNNIQVPAPFYFLNPNQHAEESMDYTSDDTRMIPFGTNAPELVMRPVDYSPDLHPSRAIAQLKVDGISALYIHGQVYSHMGNRLTCCDHLIPEFHRYEQVAGQPMMLATEFEAGQFRETLSAMRSGRAGRGRAWIYDAVPLKEWEQDDCQAPLMERLVDMESVIAEGDFKRIGCLASGAVEPDAVRPMLERARAQKLEGYVIKDADSLFTRRTSSAWLKAKVRDTRDGIVVDVTKTSLVALFDDTTARVGVGLPKSVRDILTEKVAAETLIGKALEVSFDMEALTGAPRGCTFVRWREDKDL